MESLGTLTDNHNKLIDSSSGRIKTKERHIFKLTSYVKSSKSKLIFSLEILIFNFKNINHII